MERKKAPVVIKPSDNADGWKETEKPIAWKQPEERVKARKAQDASDKKANEAEKEKKTRFRSFADYTKDAKFRNKYIVINPEAITAFVEQLQTRIEEKNKFLAWVRSQEYLAEEDVSKWIEENVTIPEPRERDMNERLASRVIGHAMRNIIVEDTKRRKR